MNPVGLAQDQHNTILNNTKKHCTNKTTLDSRVLRNILDEKNFPTEQKGHKSRLFVGVSGELENAMQQKMVYKDKKDIFVMKRKPPT